jgi:hypothetical protein
MKKIITLILGLFLVACVPGMRNQFNTSKPINFPTSTTTTAPTATPTPLALSATWTPEWSNLIGYWKMNGDWTDSSGNGNNGSEVGTATFSSSTSIVEAQSGQFDGADTINIGPLLTPSYTKMAWIYVTNANMPNNIISGGADGRHALWLFGCGPMHLSGGHNGNWGTVCDPDALAINTWYHVAMTYDSNAQVMNLYKNGELVSSASGVPGYDSGNYIRFAYYDEDNYFAGNMNEVAIWSVPLTLAEIQLIYQNQ